MTKKIYLETLKSVLGCSILHYSPLPPINFKTKNMLFNAYILALCYAYFMGISAGHTLKNVKEA